MNGRPTINTVPGRNGGGFIYTFGQRHGRPLRKERKIGVRGGTGCKVTCPNGFHWCFFEAELMSKSLLERGSSERLLSARAFAFTEMMENTE